MAGRRSPRPTPSSTTDPTTLSPQSLASEVSLHGEAEHGVDPGSSSGAESDECDADSLADASESVVRARAESLLGWSKPGKDKELSSVARANSRQNEEALVKRAQIQLLSRIRDATDTDWLRPCPAGFTLPDGASDGLGPLPWSDTAFNMHAVTRTMEEIGIDDQLSTATTDAERSYHDMPLGEVHSLHPGYLSTGVSRLDVL